MSDLASLLERVRKASGPLELAGPYHYDRDRHPCWMIRWPDGRPCAAVYIFDGEDDDYYAVAAALLSALDTWSGR